MHTAVTLGFIVYMVFMNSVFCCHIDFNALIPSVVVVWPIIILEGSFEPCKVMGKFDSETFWLRSRTFVCILFLTY